MAASVSPAEQRIAATGASLPLMSEPHGRTPHRRRVAAAGPRPRRSVARPACGATSSSGCASTARARRTSSRRASGPAGPASSSSSARSRPPTSSAARPCKPRRRPAAAPVRRHARRPGPVPVDLRRPGQRAAVGDRRGRRRRSSSRRSSPRDAGSWATGSATSSPSAWPADAPLEDARPRARRDPGRAGLPRRERRRRRRRRSGCASTTAPIFHVAKGTPAACQAELDLFREVLGADVVRETHIASGDRCCSYRVVAS